MLGTLPGWGRVLLWLLLVKLIYLGGVYLAVSFWPDMDEAQYLRVMRRWPMEGGREVASHFGTWDGAHYLYLSTKGYAAGVTSCAFYPLWPLAIRVGAVFTGGSHLIGGMVLANLFSLAGWILFYHLTTSRFGESVALCALTLLILFPGSLFSQFVYSRARLFIGGVF